MILYFYDRFFNPLGKTASNLPKGIYYTDDKQVDDVESGTSTFEFYLEFDEETRNLTKTYADKSFYIVAKDEDEETRVWQIIDDESDEEAMTRYFYCEDAGMDLINETLPAWTAPSAAQKVAYYVNKAIYDSGFEIGNNEIDNLTRTLSWDGEATALARLQSILTQFDNAEFRFRFVIDENTLELQHKYIDIYQKVGAETGVKLRYGREVKNIKVKRSKANLVNAYRCYGATPSGKNAPINLTGYTLSTSQKEINADTGKARFVLSGNILKDTESNAKYSRYLNPSEQGEDLGYYTGIYQGTAQTQKGLADEVIRKLKQTGEIEVNYEVELVDAPRTLSIGDYVYVINDADELYLEGRILKLERSRSNDTFEITLGDYLIQSSGISNQLQALADQIASLNASKNYNYTISTTNGWSFKNSKGSTTLSAVIRDNIVDVTDVFTIEWYKDDVQIATSTRLTVNASDIVDKAVYKYLAKNDDGEVAGQSEVTISNIDETKIIRQDNPPLADANTIWIDSSNQINELDVAKIYNQLKDDWVRVTPVAPDEVGAFGYESGVALTDQVNNISIDTSQLQADAEEMRANAEKIRLDMQKAREDLEADLSELQEDVDAKNSDMTQLINSNKVDTDKVLADANTAIVDTNKKIAATDENVTNINTSITNINNELATKVEKEEVDVLKQTVSNQATSIKQNSDSIALKADSETVNALNQTVINQATLIEQNAEAITSKASATDVDAVKKTVTAHDSQLTQTAKDITSLVTKTDNTNTALSEVKQTADAITTKIGAIEEDADSTSTKLSELEQNVSGFKTTVSNTYETISNVDTKANKAKNDAISSAKTETASQVKQLSDSITQTVSEKYADKNYVASQINQKAGEITSTVSSTYTTKSDFNTGINNAATDATTKANNALASAKSDATNKANDAKNQAIASAKVETASQVKQMSDSITSKVSKVEEKVDGISIGNRNYISETSWTTNGYVNIDGSIAYSGDDVASDYILIGKNKYWCAQIFEFSKAGIPCIVFYDESKSLLGSRILIQKNISGEIPASAYWLRISTPRKEKRGGRYKFEFGNKPTDWTPAPEDVDASIDGAITTSKEYTNSQIQQTANSITSTVSSTYTKQSDFNSLKDKTDWKVLYSAQDLNNLTTTGKYWIQAAPNTNAPTTTWLYVSVDAPKSDRIKQTVQQDSSVSGYWERTYNGSWSDWRKMSDESWVSSQITQTAESINSTVSQKVGKSEVISTINQSAESVTINASKINLQGALTISQFTTSDKDKINNGISTANTANSAASTAQTKANDAYSLANTANGTANTAKTNAGNAWDYANTVNGKAGTAQTRADSAYSLANTANGTANTAKTNAGNAWDYANTANNQVNSWKKSGTTKIDGGNIYADSLSVISSNMGILETYYNSDWNGKLRIEGATIRGFMESNSKLLEKSRYYPDSIEYYTHDSNGNWLNSFRLDPNGIRNDNSSYGKRRIGFKDEGIVIQADSSNGNYGSPNYLNSGIELIGKSSYIDFHDSASSTADYKSRIVHNHDSKPNQLWMLNSVGAVIVESNQAGINIDGTITLRSNSGVLAQNTNMSAWVDIRAKGFVQSSAYSLKTNFKDMPTSDLLDAINKTDIVEYQFKDDVKNGRSDKYVGMILNDDGNSPYKTSSILANEDNTAYSTTTAVGVMMGAIKELSKQNKELQAKVDTLYSFIESIDLNKITK